MSIYDKLAAVQRDLRAPKNQRNEFGGYNYRSCEDILEAVKPLLDREKLTLCIYDTLEAIGARYYIKATAQVFDRETESAIEAYAYAREEETKKGMDASQITGSASSYARKYALNGMFAIDDTKDADATNDHGKRSNPPETRPSSAPPVSKGEFTPTCAACGKQITEAEHDYSCKRYGRPLCRACQKNAGQDR